MGGDVANIRDGVVGAGVGGVGDVVARGGTWSRAGFSFWTDVQIFGSPATRRGVRTEWGATGKEVGDTGVPGQSEYGRLRGLAGGKTERPR